MKKLLIFIFLFSCSHASEFSDDAYGLHPDKPVVEEIKEYDNSDVAFKIAQEFVPVALGALPYVGHAAHHAAEATKNLYEEIHHKSDLEEASIHAASKTAATLAAESGLKSMLRSAAAPARPAGPPPGPRSRARWCRGRAARRRGSPWAGTRRCAGPGPGRSRAPASPRPRRR